MSKGKRLQKSLHDYLSKIKSPTPNIQIPSAANSFSSSKSWILSGCKHTKTLSFAIDRTNGNLNSRNNNNNKDDAATLADIDRFLFENFKSLYIRDDEVNNNINISIKEKNHHDDQGYHHHQKLGPILFDSPRFIHPPPDLCGSNRFFVAPTGFSSSVMEDAGRTSMTTTTSSNEGSTSTSTSTTTTTTTINDNSTPNSHDDVSGKNTKLPEDCIAVLTYSPSPYEDFRRSMHEMVEARVRNNEGVDWEFMEELLFCYLNLNEKKSYRFILSAFSDLIVVLRQNSDTVVQGRRSVRSVRTVRSSNRKERRKKN
ncbi:Transcription repressor like [Quillaja saponaria]|uniref:Transcription repressor n=1 Tax=Quillaja saponaria TaxID=32244 RepID=A0AAD7LRP5_QUISA|nr:Transcription repressor like [Quillaja saponaria]